MDCCTLRAPPPPARSKTKFTISSALCPQLHMTHIYRHMTCIHFINSSVQLYPHFSKPLDSHQTHSTSSNAFEPLLLDHSAVERSLKRHMKSLFQLTTLLVLATFVISSVSRHGYPIEPKMRGSIPSGENDYCPHGGNCGGLASVSAGDAFKEFAPFSIKRGGIEIWGDLTGSNDYMRAEKVATPDTDYGFFSSGFSNFGYSFNTNHQGYRSFSHCDVSITSATSW